MGKELVPEIHDIGKLIDNKNTGIEHNFENYPNKIEGLPKIKLNETWKGIFEHHCQIPSEWKKKPLQRYPNSRDTFILCIADNLAATYRGASVKGGFNIYKLWNPAVNIDKLSNILPDNSGNKWIKKIVNFVNENPAADEYFKEFGVLLKKRCAEKKDNVNSLYTHSKLTGQFYRILNSVYRDKVPELSNLTKKEVCSLLKETYNEWKLKQIRFRINFLQNPVRAKDMNIFKVLENVIENIKSDFKDNIFFSFSNELMLLVNPNEQIENILSNSEIDKYGFWIEVINEQRTNLEKGEFKKVFTTKTRTQERNIYSQLKGEIYPPICEVCQMDKATEIWERDKVVEHLCKKCYDIREMKPVLPKLVEWKEESKIIFLKVDLIFDSLVEKLDRLYKVYSGKDEGITLPVISEFQEDYNNFLEIMKKDLIKKYKDENMEQILDNIFCIKIENTAEIKEILYSYYQIFYKFFPKFTEVGSPIKFSLSCSNIKFPFFEHLRFLDNPKNEINVESIGKGDIHLNIHQLGKLLKIKEIPMTQFHKLAKISEVSEKLAKVLIYDRDEWKLCKKEEYDNLKSVMQSIDFKIMLNYVKIIGD